MNWESGSTNQRWMYLYHHLMILGVYAEACMYISVYIHAFVPILVEGTNMDVQ